MLRTITLYIKDNSIYKIEHPLPHRLGIVCLPVQQNSSITYMYMYKSTLSHRGFDNSPLLIVFSVKYIDQTKISYVWKYFGSFDMFDLFNLKRPHVRGELFSSSSKILQYVYITLSDWSKSWHNLQTTKFIQSSQEHDQ